jgi:hypothetical protein
MDYRIREVKDKKVFTPVVVEIILSTEEEVGEFLSMVESLAGPVSVRLGGILRGICRELRGKIFPI